MLLKLKSQRLAWPNYYSIHHLPSPYEQLHIIDEVYLCVNDTEWEVRRTLTELCQEKPTCFSQVATRTGPEHWPQGCACYWGSWSPALHFLHLLLSLCAWHDRVETLTLSGSTCDLRNGAHLSTPQSPHLPDVNREDRSPCSSFVYRP